MLADKWAGTTLSERARRHNVRLTLNALEEAMLAEPTREERAIPGSGTHTDALENMFDEARWTSLVDERARTRLVEDTANALGVAMPRKVEWFGRNGSYRPDTDTVTLPLDRSRFSDEEYKAIAGHELQHKIQTEQGTGFAYSTVRGSLRMLARELVQPEASLPLHLRATTMLAGASAYATFVLLGKTIGYQQELDADAGGAKASSAEAMIGALETWRQRSGAERPSNQPARGQTWVERVTSRATSRLSSILEDDHPSLDARIDNLRRQQHEGNGNRSPSR